MDQIEVVQSNKGGIKIIYNGYMYTIHKSKKCGGIRWRCAQRSYNCRGSISTNSSGLIQVTMPHNHLPDVHSVELARNRRPFCSLLQQPISLPEMFTQQNLVEHSMPLEQRLKSPILPSTSEQEQVLHSHPLSPTKLKVTRQTKPKELSPKPISPPPVEEICLKWNSHHGNMQSMFPALLLKEQYVDATLVAEGQTLKCHRMILSSCSPYFEEVLSNISPYQHPVLFMKDVPFWILKSLCDFMYSGEVLITQDKLNELLSAAENLKIKGLTGKPDVPNDDVIKEPLYKHIKEEQKDESINEKEFDKKDIPRDKKRHHTSAIIPNIIPEQTLPKNSKSQKTNDTPPIKTSKIPKLNPYSEGSVIKNTSSKLSKLHTSHIEPSPLKAASSKVLRSSSSTRKVEKSDKVLIKEAISKGDILDPFDLLEPVYEEVQNEPVIPNKLKDTSKSVSIKKNVQKKVKKRKISDDRDESPPPILSRKGTRSRPNKKIPRFYHSGFDNSTPKIQESPDTTIVREPHTSQAESQEVSQTNQTELHDDQVEIHSDHAESNMEQADPLFQLTDIKAEPFDVDDSTIEIEHNAVDFDEPVTSMNEELLGEAYESVLDFVEKNVSEKEREEDTTLFKKIRVKRQQGILNVEKTNTVKIVDVDKIKVSAEILEEDPLTLTSSLDSNIKIMTVETINENITSVNENKDSLSGNSDATFKLCTLSENSEPPKDTGENSLGFEIASVVTETEPDKNDDEQELIPVCQIAEVFSETEVIKNKIVECKRGTEDSLAEAISDISSTNLVRNEDTPDSFEGFPISANLEETLRSSENSLNEISKRGDSDKIDDDICKSSDETENVTEATRERKETYESSINQIETSEAIERVEVSLISEKSVVDESKESKATDCSNEGRDGLSEVVEERNNTDILSKIDDVLDKNVENVAENEQDLNEIVNDPEEIETDSVSKDAGTGTINSEYLEEYSNTCAENSQSTTEVTCSQEIHSNKDMGSDEQTEFLESTLPQCVEPTSSLGETINRHTIPNELSSNEDIDMPSEDNHTKDPVFANAIPYANDDLPEAPRQNEALSMEVCGESCSQGPATFDQTSNRVELVTDVPQSRFGTPGFHIAQVISEQIALNEECGLTNQPMDTNFEGSMSGSNELEMIVNDLTKIVGESQSLESNMEHEDIADSLENLLEK